MPLMRTTKGGKTCYKWGTTGKAFAYDSGSPMARAHARQRALLQGRMASKSKKSKRA